MFFSKEGGIFSKLPAQASFILGLILGILAVCTVGFFILLATVFNNKGSAAAKNNANVNAAAVQPSAGDNAAAGQPAGDATNLKAITKDDHLQGSLNAKVMMVEFSDLQCPYCSKAHETLKQLVKDYGGKVAWVYKHFPLDQLHPFARRAALASECASEQGKFWEYVDELFANQSSFAQDYFAQAAAKLGLDSAKFNSCLDSSKYASQVQDNEQEGADSGITGTPGIYINNVLIPGAQPYDSFKKVIDSFLQ
ncbi:MAG: DsbA family protein [Candidatus Komeilibacteria bacterium]|nr:DsbA family protein [Candidatus Komeilibacteria bacterium]